jgi:hypothetical protein
MKRLFVGVALGWLVPVFVGADTLRVPEDYSSIQAAIDLTSPAQVDTVLVAGGTYLEHLTIQKNLVLRGRDGAASTTLDGHNTAGNVITMSGVGRSCTIEDFTITGGTPNGSEIVGSAIYLNSFASPTIQRCRMIGNRARTGGGLDAYVYCQPLVKDCYMTDNQGGIVFELDNPDGHTWAEVVNTVIVKNQGVAITAIKGARVWLHNTTIAYNSGDGLRTEDQARVKMQNSIVTHNGGAGIIRVDNTVCFQLQCNDVFQNSVGNYLGTNPQDPCFAGRGNGDVSLDPCYQNVDADNFHLQLTSPLCSLRQPGSCGVLGAYPDPCSPGSGSCVVAVEPATWSHVKQLYH